MTYNPWITWPETGLFSRALLNLDYKGVTEQKPENHFKKTKIDDWLKTLDYDKTEGIFAACN